MKRKIADRGYGPANTIYCCAKTDGPATEGSEVLLLLGCKKSATKQEIINLFLKDQLSTYYLLISKVNISMQWIWHLVSRFAAPYSIIFQSCECRL